VVGPDTVPSYNPVTDDDGCFEAECSECVCLFVVLLVCVCVCVCVFVFVHAQQGVFVCMRMRASV
jgi:hypothetical protein